jgi:hypothetical protein
LSVKATFFMSSALGWEPRGEALKVIPKSSGSFVTKSIACRRNPPVSAPLIVQIQQAAIDRNAPLTDALTKAKVAAANLWLTEWVDRELHGYMDMQVKDLPPYRRLRGVPEGFNPYRGWIPITFNGGEQEARWGDAPIGIGVPSIEASLSPS